MARPLSRDGLAPAPPDDAAVVLDGVWKRYAPHREPQALMRALARLGGVEVDGVLAAEDVDEEEDDEELEEAAPGRLDEGGVVALREVSLVIARGTCVAVVGPRAAGKSVLLRLVAGFTLPSAGRVVVRGTVAPALASIARLVPARFGVRKSLLALAMMARLPRSAVKRRLPEIYALAGVPNPGRDRLVRLSPEQMQRVLLAMMLLVDADVVLVDVPLEDERLRRRVFEQVRERTRAGATVLVAAETAEELGELPDRVIHLDDGRVIADGPRVAGAWRVYAEPPAEPESAETPVESRADKHAVDPERAARVLPLSPDAQRYYDYIRILIGDERAESARRFAIARAPLDATRVEWTGIAKYANFEREEHYAVVERLRELHGVTDEEPILGHDSLGRNR